MTPKIKAIKVKIEVAREDRRRARNKAERDALTIEINELTKYLDQGIK